MDIKINIKQTGGLLKQTVLIVLLFVLSVLICPARDNCITIENNNISLSDIFFSIEQQTTYSIAYVQSSLDLNKKISLSLKDADIRQAMDAILGVTPYNYKIKGYHIIVSPSGNTDFEDKHLSKEMNFGEEYYIKGTVADSITGEPIEYATVVLLDSLFCPIASTVSIDGGFWGIKHPTAPFGIQISYIGYKTVTINTVPKSHEINQGKIFMSDLNNLPGEIIVTPHLSEYTVNKKRYYVTKRMRQEATNIKDLLGQVHNIRYDKTTDKITTEDKSSFLLLINGIQQTERYVDALSINQISIIEIVTEPEGRHMTEGYNTVVNMILKEDYSGYDISLRNFATVGLTKNTGNKRLMNEKPGIGITYSNKNINFYANYFYRYSGFNTNSFKQVNNRESLLSVSEITEREKPNNRYSYQANYLNTGLNYKLSPKHSLSFQVDYTFEKDNSVERFNFLVSNLPGNTTGFHTNSVGKKVSTNDYTGTLYYRGEWGNKWKIYSDFTCNYFKSIIETDYDFNNDSYHTGGIHSDYKNYTKFCIDANYEIRPQLTLNGGYVNVWRKYRSGFNASFMQYREFRNKVFAYLSFSPDKTFSVKGGLAVEHFDIDRRETGYNRFASFQPSVYINYRPNENLKMNISYTTVAKYPTIYQLSPLQVSYDSLTHISGNMHLQPSIERTFTAAITFMDRLTVSPSFMHISRYIGEELYPSFDIPDSPDPSFKYSHYFTYNNMDLKRYLIGITYNQPIGKYFNLSNSFTYYKNKIKRDSQSSNSNTADGWIWNSEVSYFNPEMNIGAQLGYHRNIEKEVLLQGYYTTNYDNWMISLNKQFLNRQIIVSVSYIPSLQWGIRTKQIRAITAPDYKEYYKLDLKPYRNTLYVNFTMRFNSGKAKKSSKQSSTEKEDRIKSVGR